jgi:hypothetical protein
MITLKHNLELLEQIGESYETGKDKLHNLTIFKDEVNERADVYSTLVSLRDKACVTLQKLDAVEVLNGELLEALIAVKNWVETAQSGSNVPYPEELVNSVINKANPDLLTK